MRNQQVQYAHFRPIAQCSPVSKTNFVGQDGTFILDFKEYLICGFVFQNKTQMMEFFSYTKNCFQE